MPRERFEPFVELRSRASASAASASARLRAVLPLRLNGAIAIYSSKVRRQMQVLHPGRYPDDAFGNNQPRGRAGAGSASGLTDAAAAFSFRTASQISSR